ncbi:MAG: Ig-like domain-containing protein [Anaerolineales bacterium]
MSKIFEPYKVFAALLIAVLVWLFPFIKHETVTVTPIDHGEIITVSDSLSAGARGPCSNVQCGPGFCCVQGACVPNNANNCNNGGSDQPPSITSDWNCSIWGLDNWCIGSLSLHLSASDPQGAAVIISGTLNGVAFACPNGAKSCLIPIPIEGVGDVTYRVHSATGLTDSGTANYKLDFTAPQLDGSLSGVAGNNNWFISNVVLDAIASDSESGLASLEAVVDGGTSTVINSPINLLDGVHTVTLTAVDVAGNVTQNTQTIQVDTITPILTTTVSGTNGANGWYVSSVVVTPVASDSGSGLATLEAKIDGGSWTIINSPISFTDGVHTYQFRATDNAGNTTESAQQTIKVDTTTPVLSINIAGTLGKNPSNGLNTGWYVSSATVTPVLVDATAGVGVVEATIDGGPWIIINSPMSFQDGIHNYQIRVTDNAGNVTTTPVQNLKIDTIAPAIDMTETLSLGETVFYSLEDMGSGLFGYRAVIEDEDENYKKIVWVDQIGGNKIRDEILWDGKFADGASAGIGEYFITLKISDRAGNQTIKTAVVSVNLLSFMQELPTFTPPTALPVDQTTQTEDSPQTGFGGDSNQMEGGDEVMISEGGNSHTWPADAIVSAGFSVPGKSSQQSIPFDPNIVWGAAAVALVGASVAEWRRQQEEHKANMMKLSAQRDAELANEAAIRASWVAEEMQQSRLADSLRWTGIASIAQAKQVAEQAAQQAAFNHRMDEHTGEQDVVDAWLAEQNRLASNEIVQTDNSSKWWEKAINWVDHHQLELSIVTGLAVAVATVAIVVTSAVTLPIALAAIGIAALVAGGLVTAGTIGLNAYYDRALTTNLVSNLKTATVTAAVATGVGLFIFGGGFYAVSSSITVACANNPTVCTRIEPILNAIDTAEQISLQTKLAYQIWVGDESGALETEAQLQLEYIDGGMPGNILADEVSNLGEDALELVATHGDDVVPLLLTYGDDAVDIIGAYGDNGISLLNQYGDDAVRLIKDYGTPAVDLLNKINPESAELLLKTLDSDVLEYAIGQGPDAVAALSMWSEKELIEFGPELALRSKKDAQVIEDISKLISLGPLDPKKLTAEQQSLINSIAENSIQYNEEGQIVLGKWVDYGNGFTQVARETGSVHYNPHPVMWDMFGEFGDLREDTAWLVNKQVIQSGIEKGLPFEYTLKGISADDILKEQEAIHLMFSGASELEIKSALRSNYIPIRIRELQELQKSGYEFIFDETNNSFIFSVP